MNTILPSIEVGSRFRNKQELKLACQSFAIHANFEYRVDKSDRTRLILKCIDSQCPWKLHASKVLDSGDNLPFEVKTMNPVHTCNGINHRGHHQATAKLIGAEIQSKLVDNPKSGPKDIASEIRPGKGVTLSYAQAYRAKMAALEAINGTEEDAYSALPKYCEDLKRNNPGSAIVLETASEPENPDTNHFKRLFICFGALAVGFAFCYPLLGLDGTHLKSKYRGVFTSLSLLTYRRYLAFGNGQRCKRFIVSFGVRRCVSRK